MTLFHGLPYLCLCFRVVAAEDVRQSGIKHIGDGETWGILDLIVAIKGAEVIGPVISGAYFLEPPDLESRQAAPESV